MRRFFIIADYNYTDTEYAYLDENIDKVTISNDSKYFTFQTSDKKVLQFEKKDLTQLTIKIYNVKTLEDYIRR